MKKEENDSKSNSNQSNMEEKKNQMNITPNVQIARALQEHEDEASKILINNFDEIVTLNKYLYDGHTVPKIVELFAKDLRAKSIAENDNVDLAMSSFFMAYNALFLNSKSITNQSERLLDFYKRIVSATPEYTYAFSGRLKSLYRTYLKYCRYIKKYVEDYYESNHSFPTDEQINMYIAGRFRDLLGYRFVVSVPICRIADDVSIEEKKAIKEKKEIEVLYTIANYIPRYLVENDFDVLPASSLSDVKNPATKDSALNPELKKYFKDYIQNPNERKYRALHIAAHDINSNSNLEIQLVSWSMDARNQLWANHDIYEADQKAKASKGFVKECYENCIPYRKAVIRTNEAYKIRFTKVWIDMFQARAQNDVWDSSGFLQSRFITPYEHLSEGQIL